VIQASARYNQLIYFDDISLKLITPELKFARQQADQALELLPLPLPSEGNSNLTRR
jgi:hypothetical protein